MLRFSRGLAIVFGVGLPIGETIRRWGRIDYLPAYLDDWLIGVLLLLGAWMTRDHGLKARATGRRVLCGAWGVACGMGYSSFFGNLRDVGQPEIGPLPRAWIVGIIGVGWVMAIVALVGAIRGESAREGDQGRSGG